MAAKWLLSVQLSHPLPKHFYLKGRLEKEESHAMINRIVIISFNQSWFNAWVCVPSHAEQNQGFVSKEEGNGYRIGSSHHYIQRVEPCAGLQWSSDQVCRLILQLSSYGAPTLTWAFWASGVLSAKKEDKNASFCLRIPRWYNVTFLS